MDKNFFEEIGKASYNDKISFIFIGLGAIVFAVVFAYIAIYILFNTSYLEENNNNKGDSDSDSGSTMKGKTMLVLLALSLMSYSTFSQAIDISQEKMIELVKYDYLVLPLNTLGSNVNKKLEATITDLEVAFDSLSVKAYKVNKDTKYFVYAKERYIEDFFRSGFEYALNKDSVAVLEYDFRNNDDIKNYIIVVYNRSEKGILCINDREDVILIRPGGVLQYIGAFEHLGILDNGGFVPLTKWFNKVF